MENTDNIEVQIQIQLNQANSTEMIPNLQESSTQSKQAFNQYKRHNLAQNQEGLPTNSIQTLNFQQLYLDQTGKSQNLEDISQEQDQIQLVTAGASSQKSTPRNVGMSRNGVVIEEVSYDNDHQIIEYQYQEHSSMHDSPRSHLRVKNECDFDQKTVHKIQTPNLRESINQGVSPMREQILNEIFDINYEGSQHEEEHNLQSKEQEDHSHIEEGQDNQISLFHKSQDSKQDESEEMEEESLVDKVKEEQVAEVIQECFQNSDQDDDDEEENAELDVETLEQENQDNQQTELEQEQIEQKDALEQHEESEDQEDSAQSERIDAEEYDRQGEELSAENQEQEDLIFGQQVEDDSAIQISHDQEKDQSHIISPQEHEACFNEDKQEESKDEVDDDEFDNLDEDNVDENVGPCPYIKQITGRQQIFQPTIPRESFTRKLTSSQVVQVTEPNQSNESVLEPDEDSLDSIKLVDVVEQEQIIQEKEEVVEEVKEDGDKVIEEIEEIVDELVENLPISSNVEQIVFETEQNNSNIFYEEAKDNLEEAKEFLDEEVIEETKQELVQEVQDDHQAYHEVQECEKSKGMFDLEQPDTISPSPEQKSFHVQGNEEGIINIGSKEPIQQANVERPKYSLGKAKSPQATIKKFFDDAWKVRKSNAPKHTNTLKRSTYIDPNEVHNKEVQKMSLIVYKNVLFEQGNRLSSISKNISQKVKYESQIKIGHDQPQKAPVTFSDKQKTMHWNQQYSSFNDSEIGKRSFKKIDTPKKQSKVDIVEQHKKGLMMRNEELKSQFSIGAQPVSSLAKFRQSTAQQTTTAPAPRAAKGNGDGAHASRQKNFYSSSIFQ